MKIQFSFVLVSLFLFGVTAEAGAPQSSMNEFYDSHARICRKDKMQKTNTYALAAENPAAWLLALAPPKKEAKALASCCSAKTSSTQANAD